MICCRKTLLVLIIGLVPVVNAHVDLVYPLGGEVFEAGSTITIEWSERVNHGAGDWDISFSMDDGSSWQTILSNRFHLSLSYNWQIPIDVSTDQAKIRVVQDNAEGMDYESISNSFTISGTTDISDSDDHTPKRLVLNPAYPNPFNGSVTISFSLTQLSHVEITIYNILGKKVEKLIDDQLNAGQQRMRWNPKNLPSGIYYYTIQSGLILESKRLVYIK